jgi:phosphonate degradation associated HDIG domain protein
MSESPSAFEPGAQDPQRTIDEIFILFARRGGDAYFGEPVSQLDHALQAALAAQRAGATSVLITAALLHDVGHLLHDLPEDCADDGLDDRHEELGARWLIRRFGPEVVEPIRLHVSAKRYLCAADPEYHAALSPASQQSLALQGGPFTAAELGQFKAGPFADAAIALRKWDDIAKIPGLPTPAPALEHFRRHIEAALNPSVTASS